MPRTANSEDNRDPLIALRIPPSLDQALRAHVEHTGSTISAVVREAIEHRLGNGAAPKKQPAAAICQHRVRRGAYCHRCQGIV